LAERRNRLEIAFDAWQNAKITSKVPNVAWQNAKIRLKMPNVAWQNAKIRLKMPNVAWQEAHKEIIQILKLRIMTISDFYKHPSNSKGQVPRVVVLRTTRGTCPFEFF
jgi:hypothetical protein